MLRCAWLCVLSLLCLVWSGALVHAGEASISRRALAPGSKITAHADDAPATRPALPAAITIAQAEPANKPPARKPSASQGEPKAARIDDAELRPEVPTLEDIFEFDEPAEGWTYRRAATAVGIEKTRFVTAPLSGGANATSFRVLPRPAGKAAAQPVIGGAEAEGAEDGEKFALPKGFVALAEFGNHASGSAWRIRCEKDNSVMAFVPAGAFLQGTNNGPPHCGPEHTVFLEAFYIDVYETTNEQYERFREAARAAKKRFNPPAVAGESDAPVLGVNWGEANFYSQWAGKALPTEAQWEKAARGPTGFSFPWGKGRFLWQRPRTQGQIDPVGSFPGDLSPYGVFDMSGNAREWCADWYLPKYYQELLESSASIPRNPQGAKAFNADKLHVLKGGDPHWFVWTRAGEVNTERPEDVGFRSVLNAKSDVKPAK